MRKSEARRVQERTLQMSDRLGITGHTPMYASVYGIADNRVSDRAEVHANLMGSPGMNRDAG